MDKKLGIGNTEYAFLSLLYASFHEESVVSPDPINWIDIIQLAKSHHVLPMILESSWQNPTIPKDLLSAAQFSAINTVIRQTQRTASFLDLYQFLADKGIYPLVLKGLVCRNLYPKPDNRPSNDEDLLVKPFEFYAAHKALLEYGMLCTIPEPTTDMHEITYVSEQLRIELHLSCFPEDSLAYGDCNSLFTNVHDNAITIEIEGKQIHTLSVSDHMLYLICHAYKHFLHSGVGIRQVCDIAIFADHYRSEIDWVMLRSKCDSIHISRFTAALFQIAEKHLGFSAQKAFEDIETDEKDLLMDILSGGVYGSAEANRIHSSTITLSAVAAQKHGKKKTDLLSSIFLPLNSMKVKYPYLKKYPWLLPGAWGQRVLTYLTDKEKKNNPAETLRIGNERVELLREYGILD